jgi:hypothetical protein
MQSASVWNTAVGCMNNRKINQVCQSGQSAGVAPDNIGKMNIRFSQSNVPQDILLTTTTFSCGNGAGLNWLTWLAQAENKARLREAYQKNGVKGVEKMLDIRKSQAYELIAKLGWRKEKISREQKLRKLAYGRELRLKRLKHLFEHYGWTPGMNCCFLSSSVKRYSKDLQIGKMKIPAGWIICVSSLPALAVRAYMKRFGLKYYVTKVSVELVEEVVDSASNLIQLCSKKHLPGQTAESLAPKNPEASFPSERLGFLD